MNDDAAKGKRLLANTVIYTISNFGSRILSFVIVPLYTYYLTTAEYGTYDTIISVVNLLSPVIILAIYEGLLRWLLKSSEKRDEIISTGLSIYLVCIIASNVILAVIFLNYNWQYSYMFMLLLTSATFQMVLQYTARGAGYNKAFAASGVVSTIVMLSLNVVLVIFCSMGINGMLVSLTVSYFVSGLYLLWNIREVILVKRFSFSKRLAKEMFLYSIMLVPNAVSWWVMNTSDRLMLTAFVGASATGLYSIACKFPSIVSVMHTIFYQAWQEQAVSEYDSDSRDRYYTKIFNTYMKFSMSVVCMLIPFSKLFIMLFMSESYKQGYIYVGVLYIASIFSSFAGFYGIGYIGSKDTKHAMQTTIIGAAINCAINLLLISYIGIWAACFSTLAAYLVLWILRIKQTKQYFDIRLDWRIFSVLLALSIIMCVLICFTNNIITFLLFAISVIVCLLLNWNILKIVLNRLIGRFKHN